MKKLLLMLMALVLSIPIWASEHTVIINRGEVLEQGNVSGVLAYYCVKDGIMMTFTDGLDNENYLVERRNLTFEVRSGNYIIKKIVMHCVDNVLEGDPNFYWGPTTISVVNNFTYPGQLGNYYITNNGYDGVWEGQTMALQFTTSTGKPVRFGSVEITYDKLDGDIFELVTSRDQIVDGQTYVLVTQNDDKAMRFKLTNDPTFPSVPIVEWVGPEDNVKRKVKVDGNTCMIRMLGAKDSTYSGNTRRVARLSTLNNGYIRVGTGNDQGNLLVTTSLNDYSRGIMYFGNNYNYLCWFKGDNYSNSTHTIRYDNSDHSFKVMDINDPLTRVWLYKLAQSYHVYTQSIPSNGGNVTLVSGVVEGTSQEKETVTFSVSPTGAYGVGEVTVTNLTTNEVTVLQPTSTSSTGNEYSFEMPAADVTVTANFDPAYEIHTVANPSDGGAFNFINGYIEYNGATMSTENQTVTFKPVPADGYSSTSVTLTDNVSGVTTTLTPDADGVYSFTMPGNDVTLTANYVEAHDLYLLGTANGGNWAPTGPKFTFDGENQVYYLDVYFKGDVSNNDPNGHFSLTKKIPESGSTNPWGDIWAYRLVADWNGLPVQDGSTGVHLYPTSERSADNAFSIPAGIYRITVNPDMTEMSITQYYPTVTFTPESGTIVQSGDVVSFTSNLNDMVHAINSQEEQATYNSYDNWGVTTSDNTHTITHDDITTVTGQSRIGYITATGSADYEIIGDLYLLGTAMGRRYWAPSGPKFNYDAVNEQYYLDVYFLGGEISLPPYDEYQSFGYFSFATHISDYDWKQMTGSIPDYYWNSVSGRLGAATDDLLLGLNETGVPLYSYNNDNNCAFKIPAGIYRIIVNKGKTLMNIINDPAQLFFDPPSGSIVEAGTTVTISSDLQSKVWAIAEPYGLTVTPQGFMIRTDDMPEGAWNDNGQTNDNDIVITRQGETTIVTGYVGIGYISVESNAEYSVPAPPVYNILTSVDPAGAGVITAPEGSIAGATINFTVTPNGGYDIDNVEVCLRNGEILPLTNNGNGNYSFTMPEGDVTIYGDFVKVAYHVATVCVPPEGGEIHFSGASNYEWLPAGQSVQFTINRNTGYNLSSVTLSYVDENNEPQTRILRPELGIYDFTMPAADVTITAVFERVFSITTVCEPPEGGTIKSNTGGSFGATPEGESVRFSVISNYGYQLQEVTMSYVDENDETQTTVLTANQGSYNFIMPAADVTITAVFDKLYRITSQCNPPQGGSINLSGDAFVPEGELKTFTVNANAGYSLTDVTMTYVNEYDVTQNVTLTPDGNGVYSFIMPAANVTINANFVQVPFGITAVCDPALGGTITLTGSAADGSEFEGQTVVVNVAANDGYEIGSVTVTIDGTSRTVYVTNLGNGSYSFVMPVGDVTVTAHFNSGYHHIYTVCSPPEGGEFVDLNVTYVHEGSEVSFGVAVNDNYMIDHVTVTNNVTGEVEVLEVIPLEFFDGERTYDYSFEMPDADVTLTAYFSAAYKVTCVVSPDDEAGYLVAYRTLDGPDAQMYDVFFQPGEQVGVDIFEELGYVLDHVTVTRDDNGESITYQNVGQEEHPDCEFIHFYTKNFTMPAADVTVTAFFRLNTPLSFIENLNWGKENGDDVIVTDTLIVVWAAKDYLWAKDMAKSNVYVEQPEGTRDYVKEDMKFQTHEWDQSNWVILDCSALYPDLSTVQRREKLNEFVDHMIAASTIQGTYYCEKTNSNKTNHTIVLSDEHRPIAIPYANNDISNSLGYPGYMQDPREEIQDYDYSYNHYVPTNFLCDYTESYEHEPWNYLFEMGQNHLTSLTEPINFFFIPPKDKEVAHVWAVYLGYSSEEGEVETDYFTTYEPYQGNGITQNVFDLPGYFTVTLSNWRFNRLRPELTDDAYGRPANIDGMDTPLYPGDAYLFHIAIERTLFFVPEKSRGRGPNTPKDPNYDEYAKDIYTVLPLDMDSHEHTYTAVKNIYSPDASEIVGISYFNMMGQESSVPFDGVNIMVVRYKDGSFRSSKILK